MVAWPGSSRGESGRGRSGGEDDEERAATEATVTAGGARATTSTLTNAVRRGRLRGRRGLTLMHGGEGSVLAVHFVKGVQAIAPRLGDERAWWPPGRLTQLRPSETWLGGGG
jgi:hypothetical protein